MPVFSTQHIIIKLLRSGCKTFVLAMIFFAWFLLLPGFNTLVWVQMQMHFFTVGLVTIPEFFLFAYVKMNSSYIDLSYIRTFHLKTQGL